MSKRSFRSRVLNWRVALVLGVLLVAGLGAFFFSRSRAVGEWELYQKELAAAGEHLDWAYFIPPAVPEAENFYAAPGMNALFQRVKTSNGNAAQVASPYSWSLPVDRKWEELKGTEAFVQSPNTISYPISVVFKWEEENKELLQVFYQACQRPQSRLLTDYSQPISDFPNFINMRLAAQALATLAQANLAAGEPEKARHDLAGIERLIDCLEPGPTLTEEMIRVAIMGLYVDVVRDGLKQKVWQPEQLQDLQRFLTRSRLLAGLAHSLRAERAGILEAVRTKPISKLFSSQLCQLLNSRETVWDSLREEVTANVSGMMFALVRDQNLLHFTRLMQGGLRAVDAKADRVFPKEAQINLAKVSSLPRSPKTFLALMAIPNYGKVLETTSRNQTLADEAALACALELFHRAEGHYPETLAELSPRYMAKLPHDVITGEALKYRRLADGFKIYSVGWDETDDGGAGSDWVWVGGVGSNQWSVISGQWAEGRWQNTE